MGLLTDLMLDRARALREKQDKLNDIQAAPFKAALSTTGMDPESYNFAIENLQKIYGTKGKTSKDSKNLFQRFGQIVHTLHGHGQQQAGQQSEQKMGSVGGPPTPTPVEGDEGPAPAAGGTPASTPIPPPPSFSSMMGDVGKAQESAYEKQKTFDTNESIREEQAKAKTVTPKTITKQITGADLAKNYPDVKTPTGETPEASSYYDLLDIGGSQYASPSGATAAMRGPQVSSEPKVNLDQGVPASISRGGKTVYPGSPEWTDADQGLWKSTLDAYAKAQKDKADLSAKRQSYFGSLPQGVLLKKDDKAKGLKAGELAFVSRQEAADHPDKYAPPAQGDQSLAINARFGEIRQTVDFLNDAIDKLPDTAWDDKSRAQIAYILRSPNPASAMDAFFKSEAGTWLTEEQQNYVTALVSMSESAQAMASFQGIGRGGSDKLRASITAMLPSGSTPSRSYAKRQMALFSQELARLKLGVPSLGGLTAPGIPPPPGSAPRTGAELYQRAVERKRAAAQASQ